jgi:hypothetical protein
LNYFLNARFYWKNRPQSDEKTGKTAHDLGSGKACPKSRQLRLKQLGEVVDK